MAFRDFLYPSVKDKLGLSVTEADFHSKVAPLAMRDGFLETIQAGLEIAVGDLGVCTEKAKSEFIIAPILLELRRLMRKQFSIFSGMELTVNKARGLNGACDFILTKGDNQHLRQAPIIAIVEAKNEDYSTQGWGQCIAAMFGAQLRNQQAGWAIDRVSGAVTTGRSWMFLHLEGNIVTIDRKQYKVPTELPVLMGMLSQLIAFSAAPRQVIGSDSSRLLVEGMATEEGHVLVPRVGEE